MVTQTMATQKTCIITVYLIRERLTSAINFIFFLATIKITLLMFAEFTFNVFCNIKRCHSWWISLHRDPMLITKELGEVPLDVVSQCSVFCILQEDIQRVCVWAVDIYLAEHIKLNTIALHKLLDFLICTWFLSTKLVAGKGKDTKASLSISVDTQAIIFCNLICWWQCPVSLCGCQDEMLWTTAD